MIRAFATLFTTFTILGSVFAALFGTARKSLTNGEILKYSYCTGQCTGGVMGPVCMNASMLVIGWHYNGTDYSIATDDRMSLDCPGCCPEIVGSAVQVEFKPGDPSQFLWAWSAGEWTYFTGYLVALIAFFLLALLALGCLIHAVIEHRKMAHERAPLRGTGN